MIIGFLQSGVSAIVPFVVLLGLLIFVHEMGHFLVAKYFGVRVETFSLGFGKKILKFKRGDTTYALSLIPLGGYVKMYGDDVTAEVPESEKAFSFSHKPVFQRIGVVLAGPMMNFFFAILIFFYVAMAGEQMRAPVVGDVVPDSAAYSSGFRSGDRIVKAGGQSLQTWDQFVHLMTENHGQSLQVEVQREGSDQLVTLQTTPTLTANPNLLSMDENVGDVVGLSNSGKASGVGIRANSVASKAGLQTGDFVRSINGHPIKYFREIENVLVSLQGQSIPMEVERFSTVEGTASKTLKLEIPKMAFSSMAVLGIESSELYLAKIVDKSPAQAAGLKDGDRIAQVNKVAPKRWEDVLSVVKGYSGEGVIAFDLDRGGQNIHLEITPKMTSQMNAQGGEDKRYTVGIMPWAFPAVPETTLVKAAGLGAGLVRGFEKTVEVTKMTALSFLRLAQAKISPKSIGGVISIGQAASETFKIGISQYLQMMAIISINLFVLNLLPIPILDGGHLLFYSIEALRGAPVSMRKMEVAQQVGLVLLMSLMVFALFNDFSRLLGSW